MAEGLLRGGGSLAKAAFAFVAVDEEAREDAGDWVFEHGQAGADDAGIGFNAGPDGAGVGAVGLVVGGGGVFEGAYAQE